MARIASVSLAIVNMLVLVASSILLTNGSSTVTIILFFLLFMRESVDGSLGQSVQFARVAQMLVIFGVGFALFGALQWPDFSHESKEVSFISALLLSGEFSEFHSDMVKTGYLFSSVGSFCCLIVSDAWVKKFTNEKCNGKPI